MWKTDFIILNKRLIFPQALWKTWENLWNIIFPVENLDKNIAFSVFHRSKISLACGNVENFCLSIDKTYTI